MSLIHFLFVSTFLILRNHFYSSSLSTSLSSLMNNEELRNWAELPQDLTSSIISRLSPIDILKNVQKVCKSWHHVCRDPLMWRKIDMYNLEFSGDTYKYKSYDLESICRDAVDRSQGGLVEIDIWYFCTDELLNYIADRSSNLRRLRLEMCYALTGNGLVSAIMKLPLLEDLEITYPYQRNLDLEAIGRFCPLLKTFKLNRYPSDKNNEDDDEAIAIAETMPELRHLKLFANRLTNSGLKAILNNCPYLEHLDLRRCFYIHLVTDLHKQCAERIRYFIGPHD